MFPARGGSAVAMLARDPEAPGKTRLGPDGPAARALRAALLLDSIEAVVSAGLPLVVFVTPGDRVDAVRARVSGDAALAGLTGVEVVPQAEGDLGARMTSAIADLLARGHDAVVLVGSDAPDLPAAVVAEAVEAVAAGGPRRVVFGPAEDGGFYLVASREVPTGVFDGVAWSRPEVLAAVTTRAVAAGWEVAHVRRWRDVDTPADLAALVDRRGPGAVRTRALLAAAGRGPGGG
ncbi:MAG: DUF2064 domain-containing protein [Vicinamibacterales bacterium]